jgi:DNA-binding beta-propeller fold protein YncE
MKLKTVTQIALLLPGALYLPAQNTSVVEFQKTIPLPEGVSRFDHFAIDLEGNRLFIAAPGSHSIEVLDLDNGKVSQSLRDLGKPHGLAWLGQSATLYGSDGTQADVKIFFDSPLKQAKSIKLSDDADDLVYNAKSKTLYVGHGGGDSTNPARIAVIDTANQSLVAEIPVSAHPEGLEVDSATGRLFANIADDAEVAVIDAGTHAQTKVWKLSRAKDNVPLAYDTQHQLLFVGCRAPARLLVLDGITGKELADLAADPGSDDLFYDAERHRIYLIASGVVDIYTVDTSKNVHSVGRLQTAPGAKTGLFVPAQHLLYVGAPASGSKQAAILVYSTQ